MEYVKTNQEKHCTFSSEKWKQRLQCIYYSCKCTSNQLSMASLNYWFDVKKWKSLRLFLPDDVMMLHIK